MSNILISFFNPKIDRHFLYSAPSNGGPTTPLTSFPRPLGFGFGLSGSSNGLVCLYDHESAFVYSPSLGHMEALPPSNFPMSLAVHIKYNVGSHINKVVRACTFTAKVPLLNDFQDGQSLEVISPGETAWRALTLPEGVKLIEDQDGEPRGCLVDGCLHYKALRTITKSSTEEKEEEEKEEEEESVIVALSLVSEEIRVLKAPNTISKGDSLLKTAGKVSLAGEYDDFGMAMVRIYEEVSGDCLRIKETRVVKKKAWFPGRRSCREMTWGSMEEDRTCTANVSLADGREVVLTGRLEGLNDNGTFLDYEDFCCRQWN